MKFNLSDELWCIKNKIINKIIVFLLNRSYVHTSTIFALFDRVSESRLGYYYQVYTDRKNSNKG